MKNLTFLFLIITLLSSCNSNSDEEVLPESIDPSDVNTLSKFITLSEGAVQSSGSLPIPDNFFSITGLNSSITSSNGATASIVIQINDTFSSNITGYYINIKGSDIYYKVPSNEISSNGLLTIPIGLPTVLEAGEFCVNVMTYDSQGNTSNVVTQCISVVRLGSGALQINLTWNTNYSDVDLHVVDPNGEEIYFGDPVSISGGQLDRDDINGFGPENIFWNNNAPDGIYKVYINDYDGGGGSKCFVTISTANVSKTYQHNLRYNEFAFITNIVKNGNSITFDGNENARLYQRRFDYPLKVK